MQKLYWSRLGETGIDMRSLSVDSGNPRKLMAEVLGLREEDLPE